MSKRPFLPAALLACALAGCEGSDTDLSAANAELDPPSAAPAAPSAPAAPAEAAPAAPVAPVAKAVDTLPEDTADDLALKANVAAQRNDLDGAKGFAEQALKLDPKHRQSLMLYGAITQFQAGRMAQADRDGSKPVYYDSAKRLRVLRDEYKGDLNPNERGMISQALYNEACTYAIDGKADEAMAALKEAEEVGFFTLGLMNVQTFREDKELDSLRDRDDFKALAATVAAKADEAEKEALAAALGATKQKLADFQSFPFDFDLTTIDGKPLKLADLKGKVTIVDIWGTWCPPCRAEIPEFVDLQSRYGDKGLQIVGINYERVAEEKMKETIAAFAEEFKINYPLAIGDGATRDQVPDFEGFPTTLFIDREGKVRMKQVGFDPSMKAELEAIVQNLLAEEPAGAKGE